MSDLELTAAFGDYDRTGLLERGTIKPRVPIPLPQGVHIRYVDSDQVLSDMLDSGELDAAFLPAYMDEIREIFGEDFWPFGIEANAATLEKLVLYAHQQGLTPRILAVEELFGENVSDV